MASQLRDLGQYVYDSIEGYRRAHERADDVDLKAAFASRIGRREATLARINTALSAMGEQSVTSGSTLGTLHDLWSAVLNALGNSDRAVIGRVEEGEDFLRQRFEEVLRQPDMSEQERQVILACLCEIAEGEFLGDRFDETLA